MKDRDWGNIAWVVLKVLFWLIVGSALLYLIGSMLGAAGRCLEDNPAISWILGIAFWVIVIWYNIHKDNKKKS